MNFEIPNDVEMIINFMQEEDQNGTWTEALEDVRTKGDLYSLCTYAHSVLTRWASEGDDDYHLELEMLSEYVAPNKTATMQGFRDRLNAIRWSVASVQNGARRLRKDIIAFRDTWGEYFGLTYECNQLLEHLDAIQYC